MKKKLVAVLLTGAMAVSMVACGSSAPAEKPADAPAEEASAEEGEAAEETAPVEASDLKVGFVTSAAGANDTGYNKSAVDAIKEAADEYGFEYRVVEPSSSLTVGQAIEGLAEDGFNLIFNLEYDFAALIDGTGATGNTPIAEQYPDTTFVIYNDNPNVNEDGSTKYSNVYSVMFNVNESSYLAGYLAVQTLENMDTLLPEGYKFQALDNGGRAIGFVGGTESAGIRVYSYGYMEGIEAAAAEYDVTYDYYPTFDAGFVDSAAGNTTAGNMYQNGCNVVFADCGNVGDGITERAEADGRLAIQTDADLDATHPGFILTSVLKITGSPTRAIIDAKVDGSLSSMDNLLNYGLDSNATGITDLATMTATVADADVWAEIVEKVNDKAAKIASGEIVVTNAQVGDTFDPATCPHVVEK